MEKTFLPCAKELECRLPRGTGYAATADRVTLNERMITPRKWGVTAVKGREAAAATLY
jgi:hypothetical protein